MLMLGKYIAGNTDKPWLAEAQPGFFQHFAPSCLSWRFSRFNPAARQLPFEVVCFSSAFTKQYPLPMSNDYRYSTGDGVVA